MRKINLIYLFLVVTCTMLFNACDKNAAEERAPEKVETTDSPLTEDIKKEREALQKAVQRIEDELKAEMQELREEIKNADDSAAAEMKQKLDELSAILKSLNADRKKLGENIEDAWDEFQEYNDWEKFSASVREKLKEANQAIFLEE